MNMWWRLKCEMWKSPDCMSVAIRQIHHLIGLLRNDWRFCAFFLCESINDCVYEANVMIGERKITIWRAMQSILMLILNFHYHVLNLLLLNEVEGCQFHAVAHSWCLYDGTRNFIWDQCLLHVIDNDVVSYFDIPESDYR